MKRGNITLGGIYISAVSVLLVAALSFGAYQYRDKQKYKNLLEGSYEGNLYSVSGYMDDVGKLLSKVEVAANTAQSVPLYAEIWKQAAAAHENLAGLPYSQSIVMGSMKYLAQLSDFSKTMLLKSLYDEEITASEKENLKRLQKYAVSFSKEMNVLIAQASLGDGVDWARLSAEEAANNKAEEVIPPSSLLGSMQQVSQTFQHYPALIYDGPFSDHVQKQKPVMTQGKAEITRQEGIEICREFLGADKVQSITCLSETPGGTNSLPVLGYEVVLVNEKSPNVFLDLSKYGGYPVWMLNTQNTESDESAITFEQALLSADEFLTKHGFNGMKYRYYELSESSVVFNYACMQNGVIMYPDLIKLKISLINGEVVGFDARGYINSHVDRKLPDTIMPPEEAQAYVSEAVDVNSIQKVVIPLSDGREAFCYEFYVIKDTRKFLIYINALTGKQENIFELVINEFGVLAE